MSLMIGENALKTNGRIGWVKSSEQAKTERGQYPLVICLGGGRLHNSPVCGNLNSLRIPDSIHLPPLLLFCRP